MQNCGESHFGSASGSEATRKFSRKAVFGFEPRRLRSLINDFAASLDSFATKFSQRGDALCK
jgi:hypothetical protein